MKVSIPPEKSRPFAHLPRVRPPFSEIAAVQTFKLMAWATATAGIYLLQSRVDEVGLLLIPYLLALLIVWDISSKLGWEPQIERTPDGGVIVEMTWGYGLRLAWIMALSGFVAWAVVFCLAPLIHVHILAVR